MIAVYFWKQFLVCQYFPSNLFSLTGFWGFGEVTFEEGKEFAGQFGMPFLETSAKATQRVDEAFDTMTREIKEKMMAKPGGGRGGTPGGPSFGQGKSLPQQTPNAEPTAEQIGNVTLNTKK